MGVSTVDAVRLCETDYERLTNCVDTVIAGDQGAPILGLPLRGSNASLGPGYCDGCQCQLLDRATTLEFVPFGQVYMGRSRMRRDGSLRKLRLCRLCLTWWQTTISHPDTLLGRGARRAEGPEGGWLNFRHGDAATFALRPRDVAIVATTMDADGNSHRVIDQRTGLRPGEMVFVAAGKSNRASTFVLGLHPDVRRRAVVVSLLDHIEDARDALVAGASDLLASPLSPQQIVGAFTRASMNPGHGKDEKTGLSILGMGRAGRDGPCLVFAVAVPSHSELLEFALLARRSLRGYDDVGTDGRGHLLMHVYAEATHSRAIGDRLATVLGKGSRLVASLGQETLAA